MRRVWLVLWVVLSLLSTAPLRAQQAALSSKDKTALAQLADVLDNADQRKVLIENLRKAAGEKSSDKSSEKSGETSSDSSSGSTSGKSSNPLTAAASAVTGSSSGSSSDDDSALNAVTETTKAAISQAASLPKKIADATAKTATEMGTKVKRSWNAVSGIFSGQDRITRLSWPYFWQNARNLALLIVSVLCLYQGMRTLARPVRRRLNDWSLRYPWSKPFVRKVIAIFGVVVMDCVFLALSYVAGNALALYAVGQFGQLSTQASLFINAFVVIELLKIGLRTVFLTRFPGLRLLTADNGNTRFYYRWLARLINLLGYGYLVAIPLVETYMSYALAQAVSTVIALIAFIYGVWVVISRRKSVRGAALRLADRTELEVTAIFIRILAHCWHLLALAYFTVLLVVTLLYPQESLAYMVRGTLKTLAIAGGGLLASALMTQLMSRHINLPENWSKSMPSIERQLNSYVPLALRIMRFVLLAAVILSILSAWRWIDLSAWAASESGQAFINRWLGAFLILLFSAIVWIICCGIIENRLSPDTGSGRPSARAETLLSLMKNAFAIVIAAVCAMMVLSQIGINIGPLIAGAGVLGLAVGFGAQTLVKDIITGIFIQLEGAMNTGDFVTVDGISGTAERITIRSVGVRDSSGTYHLIPFSSVTTVSNFMRGFAYHLAEYGISYNDDIDEACEQLKLAFDELAKGEHRRSILEPISIQGVSSLGDSSVNIRIRIKTLPGEQWNVGRAFNRLVKLYFDRAGIEIPFPHQTLYFGENKDGTAPPVNVRQLKNPKADLAKAISQAGEEHDDIPPVPDVLKGQNPADSTPDADGNL